MNSATKRSVEPADLFRLQFITQAALSPDGRQAAYVVARVDATEEKAFSAIWLVSLEDGATRQLTAGKAVDASPAWSPDSRQIAFTSTRNEKPQLFVIPVDGGEARQLTTMKHGVAGGPAWSPDGGHIAFTSLAREEEVDLTKPYRVKRKVYRFNELELVDNVALDVFIIPASGGEPRQLTHDDFMNAAPEWSPDGKEILFLASMGPEQHAAFTPVPRIANVVDGGTRDLVPEGWEVYHASWHPDGERVVLMGQPGGRPIGSKSDVWVVSKQGGKPECRTAGHRFGVGGGLQGDMPVMGIIAQIPLTADGSAAFVPAQVGGTIQILRVALAGDEHFEPVAQGDRSCMIMGAAGDRLLYLVSDYHITADLYMAHPDGSEEKRLVGLNDALLEQLALPDVEHLLFPGVDGAEVEGWIFTPPGSKRPLPTILNIHGGPHSAYGHIFNFDMVMQCGAGYAVLHVNHRASTGYGDAFSTAIKGDWGNLDYRDLMAGVDTAIARGIADPDRLGVCGLSGGGNLTCWTVGQTDRFKAAVPENPVTNWVSFYGVSDIGVWFAVEQLGGHPHEVPEVYAKCSPISYAHRCKTPTLLIQGEHDWRCPAEQSEQFYSVLKANGCEVEMLRLPGAAHAATINGAPINRRVHNEALLDWMNRHVLGKSAG